MNRQQSYMIGRDRAPILSDGSIGFYREILTEDGRELIGREYPNDGFCWFNLTLARMHLGRAAEARASARRFLELEPTGPRSDWARTVAAGGN